MATIRKRTLPSGKVRWQVDFVDQSGSRRAKLFARKKDADSFFVSARARVQAGSYLHDAGSITVGMAAEAWLDHCRVRRDAGRRMERRTCRDYEDKVRLHIKDAEAGIPGTKLSRLTRKAVNEFRDRLLASGRSEGTTRRVLGVLRLILNHAIDNAQLHSNPALGVGVLRSSRIDYKVAVPAKADVKMLIDGASGRLRAMLIVSALCGLRASETRGLRWCDIDFAAGFIHIRQRADFHGTIGEPKSAAGSGRCRPGPTF